tara:strand:- start:601 stop:1113 length:513 start_codon:yes stop_codon:yes gene_type:complete
MSDYKECQELKNIKYKSMLLSNDNKTTDITGVEKLLDNESKLNKKEPWNKLDKTIKIKKINKYVDDIVKDKYKLTLTESKNLKKYLSKSLDLVKLQRVKDVEYIKDNGILKNIPSLLFNQKTRSFTLKKCDKRISTLKSLGNPAITKKKREKREKTKKNMKKDKIDAKKT